MLLCLSIARRCTCISGMVVAITSRFTGYGGNRNRLPGARPLEQSTIHYRLNEIRKSLHLYERSDICDIAHLERPDVSDPVIFELSQHTKA